MSTIQESHFNYLRFSAFLFTQEKIPEGKRIFSLVCTEGDDKVRGVYYFIWVFRGSPIGISDYGKWSFHDQNGLSSLGQEKAQAIHYYLITQRQSPVYLPELSMNNFLFSLETHAVQQRLRTQLQNQEGYYEEPEEECDFSYYVMVGTAALSSSLLLLSLFSGRGADIERPTLAGHITVGGGHFPLSDPVQRLTNVSTSLSHRARMSPAPQVPLSRQRNIVLIEANEGNDNYPTPTERNRTYHYEGTVDRYQNGWQGSIEQKQFEAALRDLQQRVDSLVHELGPTQLQEIQRQIQELRSTIETLQQQSGDKLLEIVKKFGWMLVPKGPLQWTDIFPLMEVFKDFKEFGQIGSASKQIQSELGRLLDMERSLQRANELQHMNDLRGR